MSRPTSAPDTQVLIAGGGPIGLALAADLGRRGVRTLLVERNENKIGSAKMLEVGVRTMELCRQLGIADRVRHWGFPFDWALDSAFVTSMTDWVFDWTIGYGYRPRRLLWLLATLLALVTAT